MPQFARIFPFMRRLFPPMGQDNIAQPSSVDENVNLVHELYRGDVKHHILPIASDASAVAAAGGSVFGYEPDEGTVFIPYMQSLAIAGVTGQHRVRLRTSQTANPSPFTTKWDDLLTYCTVDVTAAATGSESFEPTPMLPWVRGTRQEAFFPASVGTGPTMRLHQIGLQFPLEVFDFTMWCAGAFVRVDA